MNMQHVVEPAMHPPAATQRLIAGCAVSVSPASGELTVVDGRVWLTRRNDLADHVLERGQRLQLQAGDAAVVEGWSRDGDAVVHWQPRSQGRLRAPFLAAGRTPGLRVLAALAAGLALAARRLEAWARSAASSASRAHGRISAGESMACGGTVQ